MSFSNPPLLSELASALKTLGADDAVALLLLKHYVGHKTTRARVADEFRTAALIGEVEANQICLQSSVFLWSNIPAMDKITALRRMTVENGCTAAEADTASHLADALAAKRASQ
ncbi:MAG TPA: hypothetical protein VMV19_09255 [Xanthobacteraceae bacterium]|nr:hypothetical protein [Xanthobacteraceae bacterium]